MITCESFITYYDHSCTVVTEGRIGDMGKKLVVAIKNLIDKLITLLSNLATNILKIKELSVPKHVLTTGVALLNKSGIINLNSYGVNFGDSGFDNVEGLLSTLRKLQSSQDYIDFINLSSVDFEDGDYVVVPKGDKDYLIKHLKQSQTSLAKLRSDLRKIEINEDEGVEMIGAFKSLLKDFYSYKLSIIKKIIYFNNRNKQFVDMNIHLENPSETSGIR